MNIRRIRAEEGLRLRELRLRALADAPTAFGSTLVEEQARPKEDWDQLAAEEASSDARARFVAEQNTRWYGMAGVFVLQDQPEIAQLISMWVDPARRRSGIARALVDAVVRWARGRGARRLQLWVTGTNHQAMSLYACAGFAATERVQPLPSNPAVQQVLMVLELTFEKREGEPQ